MTVVCIGIQGQKTRLLRTGIYLFAIMEWISAAGLPDVPTVKQRLCRGVSGYDAHGRHGFGGAAVDRVAERHHCCRREGPQLRSYGMCAAVALCMMLIGAIGMKLVPRRLSASSSASACSPPTGFNAALGVHLKAQNTVN